MVSMSMILILMPCLEHKKSFLEADALLQGARPCTGKNQLGSLNPMMSCEPLCAGLLRLGLLKLLSVGFNGNVVN